MHDTAFEQKLRAALQTEGDGLPLTVTAAELERRFALRRRGGLNRFAGLGLVAAIGVALIGLAGVAGGWFEARPIGPAPDPSLRASAPPRPTIRPSNVPTSTVPVALSSLEELFGQESIEPTQVVRAQAFGPATGPTPTEPGGPRSVTFAPVGDAMSSVVTVGCLGPDSVQLIVNSGRPQASPDVIPFLCGGGVSSRFVDLEKGGTIGVASTVPASWRIVVWEPIREPLHAASITDTTLVPEGQVALLTARSETRAPNYEAAPTGGAGRETVQLDGLATRDRYRIAVSCAGPSTIRYAIGDRSADNSITEDVGTVVECDGGTHTDEIEIPFPNGGRLFITSEARTAWEVTVLADKPPIDVVANDAAWQLSSAIGPNLELDGRALEVSLIGAAGGGDVRVVVSCEGNGPLMVAVDTGPVTGVTIDPFTVDCGIGRPATVARVYPNGGKQVGVSLDPGGSRMWIAVGAQIQR